MENYNNDWTLIDIINISFMGLGVGIVISTLLEFI